MFIVFILYIIQPSSNWNDCNINEYYYKILLSNVINKVKTGDLILFSDNIKVPSNSILGNNKFSHMGFIIIIDNVPYVYEMIQSGNYRVHHKMKPFTKDIQLTKMEDRIKYYAGNMYIVSLKKPLNDIQLEKLNIFMQNDYNYKFISMNNYILSIFTKKTIHNERFCHEFVADLLYSIDITKTPFKQNKLNLTNNIVNTFNNTLYSYPIHVIPDELLINNDIQNTPCLNYCK